MAASQAYVDTSVLGAYCCPEALSDAAERALRGLSEASVSPLSEAEFTSLLMRKRRLGELSATQSAKAQALFDSHLAAGFFRRVSLGSLHYQTARKLLVMPGPALHALDALHLSVASRESLILLTADAGFARAAQRRRCKVTMVGGR